MARTSPRDPDALDQILRQQMDVIARHQALAAGVTASALRHRLRAGGPWRPLLPGVYIAATGTPTTLQQEMAALLYAGSDSVIRRTLQGARSRPPLNLRTVPASASASAGPSAGAGPGASASAGPGAGQLVTGAA